MKGVVPAAGGFFDGKTGADKRRQYLLDLFKRSAQQEATGATPHTLTNSQVMPLPATSAAGSATSPSVLAVNHPSGVAASAWDDNGACILLVANWAGTACWLVFMASTVGAVTWNRLHSMGSILCVVLTCHLNATCAAEYADSARRLRAAAV